MKFFSNVKKFVVSGLLLSGLVACGSTPNVDLNNVKVVSPLKTGITYEKIPYGTDNIPENKLFKGYIVDPNLNENVKSVADAVGCGEINEIYQAQVVLFASLINKSNEEVNYILSDKDLMGRMMLNYIQEMQTNPDFNSQAYQLAIKAHDKNCVAVLVDTGEVKNDVIYSCTHAKELGIKNIYKGDKNYSDELDADKDGIACEG